VQIRHQRPRSTPTYGDQTIGRYSLFRASETWALADNQNSSTDARDSSSSIINHVARVPIATAKRQARLLPRPNGSAGSSYHDVTMARRATATERRMCAPWPSPLPGQSAAQGLPSRQRPGWSARVRGRARAARSTRVQGLGSSTAKQVATAARARGLVTTPIRHAVGRPYAAALRLQLPSFFSPAGGARAPCRVSFVTYYIAPTWIRARIYACVPLAGAGRQGKLWYSPELLLPATDGSVGRLRYRPFSSVQPPAHPSSCRPRQAPFAASDPSRKGENCKPVASISCVDTGGVVDRSR
jgi:hypothetical protein